MNEQALFILANQTLQDVVKHVKDSDLQRQVPQQLSWASDKNLRYTLNVFAYENYCVPEVLNGRKDLVTNGEFSEDLLKDDFQENYAKYTEIANTAARELKDLEKIVHISYGDFPARSYLSDITIQRGFATYDLAEFLGVEVQMPDELVEGLFTIVEPVAEQLREYQVFGPEVKVAEDAPLLDRLLGMAGRNPQHK